VIRREEGGKDFVRHTHTHSDACLTTALLSSGCCHLMSRHQLTGQLLLSSASTQTPGLIKPQPPHSPINHLMMSYHGDHWAAGMTHMQEHIRACAGRKGSGKLQPACARAETHTHTHTHTTWIHTSVGVPKYRLCPLLCPYPAACLRGVRNMKTLMKVAFDCTALNPGSCQNLCVS